MSSETVQVIVDLATAAILLVGLFFMLIGAVNPTPKGYAGNDEFSQRQMQRYLARLSGPLIDRIDLHVEVPAVPHEQLASTRRGTDTQTMRQQVASARQRQLARQDGKLNAALSGRELDEVAQLDEGGKRFMREAMTGLGLSARAYDKIRRVARTIADLDEAERVDETHVSEAISYRLLDRQTGQG